MKLNVLQTILKLIILASIPCGCGYIDHIQDEANYKVIVNNINELRFDSTSKFLGKSPYINKYEFTFKNGQNEIISLLFSINEANFASSTLQYKRAHEFFREARYIESNKAILVNLENNLPKSYHVLWTTTELLSADEAMENYDLMLDYIRYKIRG